MEEKIELWICLIIKCKEDKLKILDGKYISSVIRSEIKTEVERNSPARPHLCAILIGDNGASRTYVNAKVKACEEVGFKSTLLHYDDISELDLLKKIEEINNDKNIDGLIVQLPLPKHIDENKITLAVKPAKDVDGFHPVNMGKMMLGLDSMIPATPAGIIELIKRYSIQGIIISNTTDSNRDNLSDVKKNEVGGLSGQPLKDISTNLIKKFYKDTKGKIKIIGVGGVDSGQSAFEKIAAGADAVQLYTGMIYKGPGIVKDIKKELISILKKENFENISQAIGINA